MFKSIRWSLLAWQAAILLLVVVGFGAALYQQLRRATLGEAEDEVRLATAALAEGLFEAVRPRDGGEMPDEMIQRFDRVMRELEQRLQSRLPLERERGAAPPVRPRDGEAPDPPARPRPLPPGWPPGEAANSPQAFSGTSTAHFVDEHPSRPVAGERTAPDRRDQIDRRDETDRRGQVERRIEIERPMEGNGTEAAPRRFEEQLRLEAEQRQRMRQREEAERAEAERLAAEQRRREAERREAVERQKQQERLAAEHRRLLAERFTPVIDRWSDEHPNAYCQVWWNRRERFRAIPPYVEAPPPADRTTVIRTVEEGVLRRRGDLLEAVVRGPEDSFVITGRSIRPELAFLSGLLWLIGGTGVAVLAVGLAGSYVLTSRVLRPIARMSASAQAISASNLSERIDVAGTKSELGQLAAVLNATFARLEAAFERQTRFTADASHELRTPLAVILSQVELALSRRRTPEEYREALEACHRAAVRMKSLVQALLLLARADAGQTLLQPQPFELHEVVESIALLLQPLADEKRVALERDVQPVTIAGDAEQITQVVSNLLTNAIRYNREGGRVALSLRREEDAAVLCVADTGVGIPAEQLPHVFERFHRVDKARSRDQGGSGLGLAIAREIVEAHGGRIAVTSAVDYGSTFTVRLPALPVRLAIAREDEAA